MAQQFDTYPDLEKEMEVKYLHLIHEDEERKIKNDNDMIALVRADLQKNGFPTVVREFDYSTNDRGVFYYHKDRPDIKVSESKFILMLKYLRVNWFKAGIDQSGSLLTGRIESDHLTYSFD